MGKLQPLNTNKVIRILEKYGFEKIRSRKHMTFKKTIPSGEVLTTWVPRGNEFTIFVLQYIIKQTRIPREEFT